MKVEYKVNEYETGMKILNVLSARPHKRYLINIH
jgi:hypothetical protein